MSTTTKAHVNVVIDPFCYRQFAENESSKSYSGTVFENSMEDFCRIVNERYSEESLQEGYAPFCKHLFLVNDFTDAKVNVLPITKENEHLLRSRYEARNDKELPVLTRSFPRELLMTTSDAPSLPTAKYLDLILYSREQIEKENAAQGQGNDASRKAPWGFVGQCHFVRKRSFLLLRQREIAPIDCALHARK
ncbi:Protein of unknown function (DUF3228) [Fragilaria crotonensis]|nr:Protein of unknown function (DUF3228) [Fragilaria crotonensis]